MIQIATPVSATTFIIPKKVAVLMMPVAADGIRERKTDMAAEVLAWLDFGGPRLVAIRKKDLEPGEALILLITIL